MSARIFRGGLRRRQRGFTLIEVLVAILILAFGLLGFAMLQTMSVRFVQSSNYRTQATNLAYDLLDQMRANRYQAAWYSGATFAAGAVSSNRCSRPTGDVSISGNIGRWQCQVVNALGDDASATVTYSGGNVSVSIAWGDQRWSRLDPTGQTVFEVRTAL